MSITITIDGIEHAKTYFSTTLANDIKAAVKEAVDSTAQDIYDTAKRTVPVDTGALRDSIQMETHQDMATVSVGEDYASYVDEGTVFMDAQPFFKAQAQTKTDLFYLTLEKEISRRIQSD